MTWTDCDEAEGYVVFNVLSPRDLVFRPDFLDETVTSSSSLHMMLSSLATCDRPSNLDPLEVSK